jgi:hypothetical protein
MNGESPEERISEDLIAILYVFFKAENRRKVEPYEAGHSVGNQHVVGAEKL